MTGAERSNLMTKRFLFCESGEPHGLKKPEYFDTKSSNKKTSLKPFWQMTKRESSECCLSTVNKREGWEGHHEAAAIFCNHTRWEKHSTQRRPCQNTTLSKFSHPGLGIMHR